MMKQNIHTIHLPQELTINYQQPHGPGKANVDISFGIATEDDELRTSWKETEKAIEFSGVCPLSATNSSIKISHDGCKLKVKNWCNNAELDKLYDLHHNVMKFVNFIVETGQCDISHDVAMKGNNRHISAKSMGDFKSPHKEIDNVIATIDAMEHISSTLLDKMQILKSKINFKTALLNREPEESYDSLQNLLYTIDNMKSNAEQAIDESTPDNNANNTLEILDARKRVYTCLNELMEIKRLLKQACAARDLINDRKLNTSREVVSHPAYEGTEIENMMKTVIYDAEQSPDEVGKMSAKSMRDLGNSTTLQPNNVNSKSQFEPEMKNKLTILIEEDDMPESFVDIYTMDSDTNQVKADGVTSESKSNISSASGTKRVKEVRIDESQTMSAEKGWPAIGGSRRYPKKIIRLMDSIAVSEVRASRRCPNCFKSLNSTVSIGVGSFPCQDETALIPERLEGVAKIYYLYETRANKFFPLDNEESAVNFLGVEANESQSAIKKLSEQQFGRETWKQTVNTFSERKSYCQPNSPKNVDKKCTPGLFQFRNGKTPSKIMEEIISLNISTWPPAHSLRHIDQGEVMNIRIGLTDQNVQSRQDVNHDMKRENMTQTSFGAVETIWPNNQEVQDELKMHEHSCPSYTPSLRSLPLNEEDVKTIIASKPEDLPESNTRRADTVRDPREREKCGKIKK